jgi:gamma-glutamylcyclotransferase
MSIARLRARVDSARFVTTGHITHRRLAFHKRGDDGSAKADAFHTGDAADRVWGVVFSISTHDKPAMDGYEGGYEVQNVSVVADAGTVGAITYVARNVTIEPSLLPFSWYLSFVHHGAEQYSLPSEYIERLQSFESVLDPDTGRHERNSSIIAEPS